MLRTRLCDGSLPFTHKEQQISGALLANYPAAGLSTVTDLAACAGVSVPTVLRFVAKLGFSGFPAFQKSLIDEVGNTLNSPLSLFRGRVAAPCDSPYQAHMQKLASALEQSQTDFVERDFEGVVDLLADERSDVRCLGGRFSTVVAARLSLHLAQIRPGVRLLDAGSPTLVDTLVDCDNRLTLVVFDFRRYQSETACFAQLAAKRRARIVLFTDRWRSPIATFADKTLVSPVESGSLFDSWVPAIAQTEALVAAVAARNPDRVRERLAAIEALRDTYAQAHAADDLTGGSRAAADQSGISR